MIDLEREQREQDGTEWMYGGSSAVDLAAVPLLERDSYQPQGEVQVGAEDFEDCASRSPINILATKFTYRYAKGLFLDANKKWLEDNGYVQNGKVDFSDRFISIRSGTTRQGNSLKAPLEAIRKGLIPKPMLPAGANLTFDEYQNPAVITKQMEDLATEFARRFKINYEQVFAADFLTYLVQDELNVVLFAWPAPVNGIYPRVENPFDHAIKLIKPDFFAFDNYLDFSGGFVKQLARDYKFMEYGYRVILTAETDDPVLAEKQSVLAQIMYILSLQWLLAVLRQKQTAADTPAIPPKPAQDALNPAQPAPIPVPAPTPVPALKYDWSTPEAARHSVRLIADEEGLTVQQKNDMCRTIHCESGFKTTIVHPNLYNGKVVSTDYGICQWNDKYHGAEISPDDALHNPEKAVRLMCAYVKRGQLNLWVCYAHGLYKQYTA
ncbi:hypothetical protein [Bradyrhizobium elkanii]|uniref:hypothetical protein n=1 Tax=Bradyrhizobium elkanii TaxID=29448 RepID=UPI003D1AA0DC